VYVSCRRSSLFLAQLLVLQGYLLQLWSAEVKLEEFNVGIWFVLFVACDRVGVSIPVDSHINSLCFVWISPEVLAD